MTDNDVENNPALLEAPLNQVLTNQVAIDINTEAGLTEEELMALRLKAFEKVTQD